MTILTDTLLTSPVKPKAALGVPEAAAPQDPLDLEAGATKGKKSNLTTKPGVVTQTCHSVT